MESVGATSPCFQLDPLYENLSCPKFFDFTEEEKPDELGLVESWFLFTPADPISPQVEQAKASGKSLAPLSPKEIWEALQEPEAREDKTETQGTIPCASRNEDEFTFPSSSVVEGSTPDIQKTRKFKVSPSSRCHSMTTRSLVKDHIQMPSPIFSEPENLCSTTSPRPLSPSPQSTPNTGMPIKSLYAELCTEMDDSRKDNINVDINVNSRKENGEDTVHNNTTLCSGPIACGSKELRELPPQDSHLPQRASKRCRLETQPLPENVKKSHSVAPSRGKVRVTKPLKTEERNKEQFGRKDTVNDNKVDADKENKVLRGSVMGKNHFKILQDSNSNNSSNPSSQAKSGLLPCPENRKVKRKAESSFIGGTKRTQTPSQGENEAGNSQHEGTGKASTLHKMDSVKSDKISEPRGFVSALRSVEPLTIPKEFNFKTTSRLGARKIEMKKDEKLEDPKTDISKWEKKSTQPRPFRFATEERVKMKEDNKNRRMISSN